MVARALSVRACWCIVLHQFSAACLTPPHQQLCYTGSVSPPECNNTTDIPWQETPPSDLDGSHDGSLQSITAMPEYAGMSQEELRWNDYQVTLWPAGQVRTGLVGV